MFRTPRLERIVVKEDGSKGLVKMSASCRGLPCYPTNPSKMQKMMQLISDNHSHPSILCMFVFN